MKWKLNSQKLSADQYRCTNKIMYVILILSYIAFIGIEYSNFTKNESHPGFLFRGGLYIFLLLLLGVVNKIWGDKKRAMIIMALSYLVAYPLLAFGNGAGCLALAFPVLVGFMIYLNARIVSLGVIATFLVCAIKSCVLKAGGDITSYGFANVVTIGLVISLVASFWAINSLIRFDKENREEVEEQVRHSKAVAASVAEIVGRLDDNFQKVMIEMDNIGDAMTSAHGAMETIAYNSEDTAKAVGNQANMTGEIQSRLESTNDTAMNSMSTAEELRAVVENGKQLADDLHSQSVLVDENTARISETVALLVENVQKVSGITESILNISSQTNLLALNASIEAARAGEAGRGFAVVADQIRNLAEETKISTEKITVIINELTKITSETQQGIEESVDSIAIQRQKVDEVNSSFTQVEHGMVELSSGVESMNGEVQEVLEANRAIVESVEMLSSSSQEVSAEAQNSKITIDQAFDSLNVFVEVFQSAFEELENLKQATEV